MVHVVEKKIKGNIYLYLEERAWIDNRSKRIWSIYLGSKSKIQEIGITISPKQVEYQSMQFGISAALVLTAKKIDFVEVINSIAGKKRDQNLTLGDYILITTINRCISPCSKRKLGDWFKKDFLSTIYPIDPKVLNSQTYWNHFQLLNEQTIGLIEQELTRKILYSYKIDLQTILYDPTNFYTFIEDHSPEQLANFGKSKEGRNALRIINVSLLCSLEDGIPLFHQTYEGNTQDAKHFKGVINKITNRFQQLNRDIEELVLVFDKGNHSDKAFEDIESLKVPFIASVRNSSHKELMSIPLDRFTEIKLPANGKLVSYYKTQKIIYKIERTVYVLYDAQKKKRAVHQLDSKIEKRQKAINEFLLKLNVKKWRSEDAVKDKLSKIIGKNPYKDIITFNCTGDYGNLQVTITINEQTKKEYTSTLGRCVIFTDREDWKPVEVIQVFRDKYVVEDCFKHMKNPQFLSIRPMFHWANNCIRVHVFTCILGLILLALVRKELKQKKINISYKQILSSLADLELTQIFTSSNGPPMYKLNRKPPMAKNLFSKLNLKTLLPKNV